MSFDALRSAVSEQMVNNWHATPLDRITHGNNRAAKSIDDGDWVRLSIHPHTTENAELGTGFQRTLGIINVQCFTQDLSGEKSALFLVDDVVKVFQNQSFSGVTCYAVTLANVGRQGKSFQMNATVNFKYDVFS